jgi:hypothetical protein
LGGSRAFFPYICRTSQIVVGQQQKTGPPWVYELEEIKKQGGERRSEDHVIGSEEARLRGRKCHCIVLAGGQHLSNMIAALDGTFHAVQTILIILQHCQALQVNSGSPFSNGFLDRLHRAHVVQTH